MVAIIFLFYAQKVRRAAKFSLGIANCTSELYFFGCGAQPIQCYFALPFCLLCGALFLCESWHNRYDTPSKSNFLQKIFLFLGLLYPLFSLLSGRRFPQKVTRIMPCPLASLRTTVCAAYPRKNKFLLILLTICG